MDREGQTKNVWTCMECSFYRPESAPFLVGHCPGPDSDRCEVKQTRERRMEEDGWNKE